LTGRAFGLLLVERIAAIAGVSSTPGVDYPFGTVLRRGQRVLRHGRPEHHRGESGANLPQRVAPRHTTGNRTGNVVNPVFHPDLLGGT